VTGFGIPYARVADDGRSVTCPVCGARVELRGRKDADSMSSDAYARHYAGRHAVGCPSCGRDIDRLGGNPDCETCAAEPSLAELPEVLR
jgi:hypothetical protein